jgi:hypothetical protein
LGETFLLAERELLIPEHSIWVETPRAEYAPAAADLYRQAYVRNDFFAGRYEDPYSTIFNPAWVAHDFEENSNHKWFAFTDNTRQLIGMTGWFHDQNIDGYPVMTSDETQIALAGRGHRIMDHFFRQIVPRIEAAGNRLATSFVLTPQTKGLRRTLEIEEGMFSLGILPHVLRHRESGMTRSEIVSAKFKNYHHRPVTLLANFEPLYRIIQSQEKIPKLSEPVLLPAEPNPTPIFSETYEEAPQLASGADPEQQRQMLQAGYQPVAYYPRFNGFVMARFPKPMPELDFIFDEAIDVNKDLVRYLQEELYNENEGRL